MYPWCLFYDECLFSIVYRLILFLVFNATFKNLRYSVYVFPFCGIWIFFMIYILLVLAVRQSFWYTIILFISCCLCLVFYFFHLSASIIRRNHFNLHYLNNWYNIMPVQTIITVLREIGIYFININNVFVNNNLLTSYLFILLLNLFVYK